MKLSKLALFAMGLVVFVSVANAKVTIDQIEEIYMVKRDFKLNPGESQRVFVACNSAGEYAMAGGVGRKLTPNNANDVDPRDDLVESGASIRLQESFPAGKYWVVHARNVAGTGKDANGNFVRPEVDMVAYATCVDATGLGHNLTPVADEQGAAG